MLRRASPVREFDGFVRALQSEVGAAQKAVAARHAGIVKRMVEFDSDGTERAVTWSFCLPSASAGGDRPEEIRLPLLSLRHVVLPQVTQVSMEVLAAVEEEKERSSSGPGRLILVIRERPGFLRRTLHRLRIRLTGRQPGRGDVSIDDVAFKRIGDDRD